VVGGEVVGRGEAAVEGALIEGLHEDGAEVDLLVTKYPFDLRIRTHGWVSKTHDITGKALGGRYHKSNRMHTIGQIRVEVRVLADLKKYDNGNCK
jgi:hypothetical protein